MISDKIELFREIEHHLLIDESPSRFLNNVSRENVFLNEYPFSLLGAMKKTPQTPIHHPEGNVWNHTMMVVDHAARMKSKSLDARVFMWAALLHDIGKPTATRIKLGRITSYNHEKIGSKMAGEFLREFGEDERFISRVAALVRWHMQILFAAKGSRFAEIGKMLGEVPAEEIALLGLCDRLGRKRANEGKERKNISIFLKKCREYKENIEKNKEMGFMDKKIRLGVIGTGLAWDRLHYPALRKLADKFEIAAICNKSIDKARGFAKLISLADENIYGDYNKMLKRDDIDAVDLLVPISENYEVAKAVIKAKKHLIAEKPFASTPEGARELIDLKNQYGVKVLVAENFRYNEENVMIKDMLQKGTIGEVMYFIENTGANFEKEMKENTFAAKEWRQHPVFKGGVFLDSGVHDIARMRFLFGEIESVYASGRPQQEDYSEYMSINATIKFKNGVTGQYSFYSEGTEPQKPPVGLRIMGTLGEIYLESKDKGVIQVYYKDGKVQQMSFTPNIGFYHELLNFYNALVSNAPIVSTPEKELGDIETVFSILESAEKDRLVTSAGGQSR